MAELKLQVVTKDELASAPDDELNMLAAGHFGLVTEGHEVFDRFWVRPGSSGAAFAANLASVGNPARPDATLWNPARDEVQASRLLRWASENHRCLFEVYYSRTPGIAYCRGRNEFNMVEGNTARSFTMAFILAMQMDAEGAIKRDRKEVQNVTQVKTVNSGDRQK